MMTKDEFLVRARRSLALAIQHRNLRDVTPDITNVREYLASAGAQPASIGVTENEFVEIVRDGYMAEARMTFELAVDTAVSQFEKDFFFSELVGLISKAMFVEVPTSPTIREEPLTAERAPGKDASDEVIADYIRRNDPYLKGLEESGAFDRKLFEGLDTGDLHFDFSSPDGGGSLDAVGGLFPEIPVADDDPDPVITLGTADLDEPKFEVTEDSQYYDHIAVKFFGEKDAIALGLVPAPTEPPPPTPPRRAVPPPLPKRTASVANDA